MRPTFHSGQIVLGNRTFERSDINIGDIVVFKDDTDHTCVKRVLALPGEVVVQTEGRLYINGIEKYPYETADDAEYILNEDEVYVCGDNHGNSVDSRTYGPVSYEKIECIVYQ